MIVTFNGIVNQVLRVIDEEGDTSTTRELVEDFVNQAHQQRLMEYPWPFMLMEASFDTVIGQQMYPLHQEFARPYYFYNSTQRQYMVEVPTRQIEPDGQTPTGTIEGGLAFTLWGRTPVQYQPTSASLITIVSDNSADTGSTYQVVVKGLTSAGIVKAEIITPAGLSSASTVTQFSQILAVTKAAEWNGNLTMTSNSGAVTNLTLNPTEMGRSYQQMFLLSSPAAVETISYRFFRQPLVLVNDYDIPELPPPHSQILVWDALMLFGAYNSDVSERALAMWRQQQQRLEVQLQKAFEETQSLGAAPRYVRYINEDSFTPRVNRP